MSLVAYKTSRVSQRNLVSDVARVSNVRRVSTFPKLQLLPPIYNQNALKAAAGQGKKIFGTFLTNV
jgi:hypothetical protein